MNIENHTLQTYRSGDELLENVGRKVTGVLGRVPCVNALLGQRGKANLLERIFRAELG
jgi:hypothetical protein